MSLMTAFIRFSFKRSDDVRDRGLTTPEDIERWDDVCYGSDARWQVLDAYRPKNVEGPLPVIVSIHGGGWTYGDKERYQYYCMSLAQHGFAVVNFTYRLAPEFKFPAGIEDTNLVFEWLMKQEACGWFDLDHIFVVGDSAGGHMATIYSAACSNSEYAKKLGITIPLRGGKPVIPTALGLNCGVYEIDPANSHPMTKSLMKALLTKKGAPEEYDLINPLTYLNASFPPAYIMTANQDPLAGPPAQSGLTAKLTELGIPFRDVTYGDPRHPQEHVFHCDMNNEVGRKCNNDECEYFRGFLN